MIFDYDFNKTKPCNCPACWYSQYGAPAPCTNRGVNCPCGYCSPTTIAPQKSEWEPTPYAPTTVPTWLLPLESIPSASDDKTSVEEPSLTVGPGSNLTPSERLLIKLLRKTRKGLVQLRDQLEREVLKD